MKARGLNLKNYICEVKTPFLRSAILIFFSFMMFSCFEQGDCLMTNSREVKVSLLKMDDKKTAVSVLFDSVFVPGRITLYDSVTASALQLPLDPARTETAFVLVHGTTTDTLVFSYRNEVVVLSPACGAVKFHHDLEVIRNSFGADRLQIINRELLKNVATNVNIYF